MLGMSQTELGAAIDNVPADSEVREGYQPRKREHHGKLAGALGVPTTYFFDGPRPTRVRVMVLSWI
jgi:hypothetical protein